MWNLSNIVKVWCRMDPSIVSDLLQLRTSFGDVLLHYSIQVNQGNMDIRRIVYPLTCPTTSYIYHPMECSLFQDWHNGMVVMGL